MGCGKHTSYGGTDRIRRVPGHLSGFARIHIGSFLCGDTRYTTPRRLVSPGLAGLGGFHLWLAPTFPTFFDRILTCEVITYTYMFATAFITWLTYIYQIDPREAGPEVSKGKGYINQAKMCL